MRLPRLLCLLLPLLASPLLVPPPPSASRPSPSPSSSLSSSSSSSLSSSSATPSSASPASSFIAAQQRLQLETQQQQIESLVGTFAAPADPSSAPPITPLKVHLFIDGTWLYYGMYSRQQSALPERFGQDWAERHRVRWSAIPSVVVKDLKRQMEERAWDDGSLGGRPLEVTNAHVYTSMKAATDPASHRFRMFEDMKEQGFDVYKMVTEGESEKCIDIQLAVEMLHFATVPESYDVAVILTGDKDFMPAMERTRQKSKRVALASMRRGCNRALQAPSNHIRDFDIIWLDEPSALERIVQPDENAQVRHRVGYASEGLVLLAIARFVERVVEETSGTASSRDVGRFLKGIKVGTVAEEDLLQQVKNKGGLRTFLSRADVFDIEDESDMVYRVSLRGSTFVAIKKKFQALEEWETKWLDSFDGYSRTLDVGARASQGKRMEDFDDTNVAQLRKLCKERGLRVSGVRAELVARLVAASAQEAAAPPRAAAGGWVVKGGDAGGGGGGGAEAGHGTHADAPLLRNDSYNCVDVNVPVRDYLVECVRDLLVASGGRVGSRDIGRYLAACPAHNGGDGTALNQLKREFVTLIKFLDGVASSTFVCEGESNFQDGVWVTLRPSGERVATHES
ncbi:hypothetical protein TeGR_g14838 [Tetraparma gracilis]|uniref:SAP domain-containing protein n=1 Tax=Tetraparma gracilis TaxID=2962635 RepID=A0ABQ6M8C0_9STRA|nr:hypothetical protein TeGR_g14838 [Tetraparma gracilis]